MDPAEDNAYCIVTEEGEDYVMYSASNIWIADSPALTPSPAVLPNASVMLSPEVASSYKDEDVFCDPEPLEFWDIDKVNLLLMLTHSHKHSVLIRDNERWKEIADVVGIGHAECLKKYLYLRNTFMHICKTKVYNKNWLFYEICEEAFKDDQELTSALDYVWTEKKTKLLLELYIAMISDIKSATVAKNHVWKDIASKIGNTASNCHEKFRSLKSTYMKMTDGGTKIKKANKWPYTSYFETILKSYNPPRWKHEQVRELLDAFKARIHKVDSLNKKKEIWTEISEVVGIDAENCHHKYRNLKLTYTKLKTQQNEGKQITNWQYFHDFEMISKRLNPMKYKVEEYVKVLLQCYYDNKEKFFDQEINKKMLWKEIGQRVGRSASECDVKFRNLKMTYRKVSEVKKQTGIEPQWPYFTYFERIYNEPTKAEVDHTNDELKQNFIIDDGLKNETCTENVNTHKEKLEASCSNKREELCRGSCCQRLDRLLNAIEESNRLQSESNYLLKELLKRK